VDVIGTAPARPGRGPRRWARLRRHGRWVVPIVAALGLVGYVGTHRYQPPPAPLADPAPAGAGMLTGRSGFGPVGLRVVLSGAALYAVDLHTGVHQVVRGFPARVSTEGASAAPVPGGLVVRTSGRGSVDSYLVRPGRPARLVVRNGVALPSWDGRGVVVSALPIGTESYSVTGQTLDGRRLWQWVAPNHTVVVRDTRYGLLVRDTDPPVEPQRLRLVRRESGEAVREIRGTAVAVGGDAVARLRPGCGHACTLALTRLPTGVTTPYPLPTEPATGHGSFAPGGRWLALPLPPGPAPGALPDQPSTLTALDLDTGATRAVPGLAFPAGEPPLLAWSADGRWLVVAVRAGDRVRLGLWRPDTPDRPLTVLPASYPADSRTTLTALS
jgi:hypothetical protein